MNCVGVTRKFVALFKTLFAVIALKWLVIIMHSHDMNPQLVGPVAGVRTLGAIVNFIARI